MFILFNIYINKGTPLKSLYIYTIRLEPCCTEHRIPSGKTSNLANNLANNLAAVHLRRRGLRGIPLFI